HYNHRPHRALDGRTPAQAWQAAAQAGKLARPAQRPIPGPFHVRQVKATDLGVVPAGRYRISIGRQWAGLTMTVIRDGDHIAIYAGNQLIRALDADPTRSYQLKQPTTHPTDNAR
ncbi:MAG TPA: hypothetical protein VGH30_13320, partial [Jatrophihabitantaceae bacterium]